MFFVRGLTQHDDMRRRQTPKFNSSQQWKRLSTAETHLTITQSSYVTQAQSKHTHARAHARSEEASLTRSAVGRETPDLKAEKCKEREL